MISVFTAQSIGNKWPSYALGFFYSPPPAFNVRDLSSEKLDIRKICPCIEYPLIPYFYIVRMGFAGVYLFFLFLLQNIDCGYSLPTIYVLEQK